MTIEKFAGFVEMQRKVKHYTQEELAKNYSLPNAVSKLELLALMVVLVYQYDMTRMTHL